MKSVFPFTAIVGQEDMKMALILNAINPHVGGVLIRGDKGTAKSTAVRSLAFLLPEIEVVKDCRFNCNPHQPGEMCHECRDKIDKGEKLDVMSRPMRVVDLPLGATEDRVVGSIDIERAIKKGNKAFEPGILAEVHRGILYVDEVNLLDDHLVDILLDSAAMGLNIVEREGISFIHPARFILIGTMNPEEGELRPQLLDRFGLCVEIKGINNVNERMEIIRRWTEFEKDPNAFEHNWKAEQEQMRNLIAKAKEILPLITYPDGTLELIARIAMDAGANGHRADIFMLKTAKTITAYHHRTEVTEKDVYEAAKLVLPHRVRRPFPETQVRHHGPQPAQEKERSHDQASQGGGNGKDRTETPATSPEAVFETGSSLSTKRESLTRRILNRCGI
ncbi:MAG TPA: magnesium chelatase ATPase subunit I [Syntrophaceae bacterium]|nr:magnesium chelatase ATPase subunit I [Syntrophaceae bacterium]